MSEKTVQEIIKEHMPCEVCGNNNIRLFRLRGTKRGKMKSVMMVKCDICEEVWEVKK